MCIRYKQLPYWPAFSNLTPSSVTLIPIHSKLVYIGKNFTPIWCKNSLNKWGKPAPPLSLAPSSGEISQQKLHSAAWECLHANLHGSACMPTYYMNTCMPACLHAYTPAWECIHADLLHACLHADLLHTCLRACLLYACFLHACMPTFNMHAYCMLACLGVPACLSAA
jgi:hypothetical protein